jgi:hypothetical protein
MHSAARQAARLLLGIGRVVVLVLAAVALALIFGAYIDTE